MNRWLERSLIAVAAAALGAVALHLVTLQALARTDRGLRAEAQELARAPEFDFAAAERLLVRLERQRAVLNGALIEDVRMALLRRVEVEARRALDPAKGIQDEARLARVRHLLEGGSFGPSRDAEMVKAQIEMALVTGINRCVGDAEGVEQYRQLVDCPFYTTEQRARAGEALRATGGGR